MKRIPKILSIVLSAVLLLSTSISISAITSEEIISDPDFPTSPIHKDLLSNPEELEEWFFMYHNGSLGTHEKNYLAHLWFDYAELTDDEPWPEEYLSVYNDLLYSKRLSYSTDHVRKVDDFYWNGNTVAIDCSIDYFVKYYIGKSYWLELNLEPIFNINTAIAIWDKTEEKYIAIEQNICNLEPSRIYTDDEIYDLIAESENGKLEYTKSESASVSFVMPDYFDADKFELHFFFCELVNTYHPFSPMFSEPFVINTDGYDPDHVNPEPEPEPEPVYSPGDANSDGKINLTDAALMLQYIADWTVDIDPDLADINGNGKVSLMDVQLLLQKIAWGE